jgi:uncharacterized protein
MRMRSLAFLAALAWLLACSPAARPAPATQPEPALWRIADADSEIWLFGTAHELPTGVRWRGSRVNAAFNAADEIITETDTTPAAITEYQRLATELGTLPPGQSLFTRISAEDRARLDRVARAANLQPEQFTQVRPWLAALQLSIAHEATRGAARENGVETVLLADAQTQHKRLTYFETPSQQVHFLSDLSPADEAHFLSVTLRQIETEGDHADELNAQWARGDTRELGEELDNEMREAGPAVYAALITNRNRAWTDEIQRRLNGSGKVFIAVGAAHLTGDGSVVSLLRQRGVTVEGP